MERTAELWKTVKRLSSQGLSDYRVAELTGVRVTQSSYRNLSVSHRKSVAILERVVGAKS